MLLILLKARPRNCFKRIIPTMIPEVHRLRSILKLSVKALVCLHAPAHLLCEAGSDPPVILVEDSS